VASLLLDGGTRGGEGNEGVTIFPFILFDSRMLFLLALAVGIDIGRFVWVLS